MKYMCIRRIYSSAWLALFPGHSHVFNVSRSHSSIPLTGDSRADADIIAFYRARQKLIQKGKLQRKCCHVYTSLVPSLPNLFQRARVIKQLHHKNFG